MAYELPKLPFSMDALAPMMSRETLEFHYGKHHQRYVDNLNKLVKGTEQDGKSLEDLIKTTKGGVFNNAAQVWNHTFFWNCMTPSGGGKPKTKASDAITKQWGSFDKFKTEFSDKAVALFGSGWTWLAKASNGTLSIENTSNAENPMTQGMKPLLTIDVWEHAYYIDYRNDRARFVNTWWDVVNWDFVEKNF